MSAVVPQATTVEPSNHSSKTPRRYEVIADETVRSVIRLSRLSRL